MPQHIQSKLLSRICYITIQITPVTKDWQWWTSQVNIQLPTLFGFKIFQHTIRSPFLIPVITSHWISSYLVQFTIWFIALLFWFLDHINGFLLTSLYSKYLVLVLPRAAYLEHYVYDKRDRGELARKKTSSRCQTRRWHTLTTEEQMVPSKWYLLLARDTCVINRSGLQNLLGSIICKQKLRTSIGKKGTRAICVWQNRLI